MQVMLLRVVGKCHTDSFGISHAVKDSRASGLWWDGLKLVEYNVRGWWNTNIVPIPVAGNIIDHIKTLMWDSLGLKSNTMRIQDVIPSNSSNSNITVIVTWGNINVDGTIYPLDNQANINDPGKTNLDIVQKLLITKCGNKAKTLSDACVRLATICQ